MTTSTAAVTVRRLVPADVGAESAVEDGLGPDSRHLRWFGSHNTDRSKLLRSLEDRSRIVLGAFVDAEPVGIMEIIPTQEEHRAEFAIEVCDRWQRRGIGSQLLEAGVGAAAGGGFTSLVADVLAHNTAMRKLLHDMDFPMSSSFEYGVVHSVVDISAARKCVVLGR
jgi:GNAT superfamily N-acetyltransferase